MKTLKTIAALSAIGFMGMTSCNDFLDIAPTSTITSDNYFKDASQLSAYTAGLYSAKTELAIPGANDVTNFYHITDFGVFGDDLYSDNQTNVLTNEKFTPDLFRVPATNNDDPLNSGTVTKWDFSFIYECNYFLDIVLPKYKAGAITGVKSEIEQAIGEVYFFRAVAYARRLERFGDFPIVKHPLRNDPNELMEAAARSPRNEVARFIISDLDSAVMFLNEVAPDGRKNKLYKDVANLYKSRVALFEGTFLKYFKGTPFVPQGPDWPGATKAFKDYQYPSGSIDNEIDYFLDIAMKSAQLVADKYPLVENTGIRLTKEGDVNPYVSMFGEVNLSGYSECMIWRAYVSGLKSTMLNRHLTRNNAGIGITRSVIRSFVDKNGLPPYAPGALWTDKDENSLYTITKDRDSRAQLFIKVPGQVNTYLNRGLYNDNCFDDEPVPLIYAQEDAWEVYTTGYVHCKGMNPDASFVTMAHGIASCPAFRSAEAYMNYVEACYEKTGTIDGTADRYWKAIRKRAKINEANDGDWRITVENTNMTEEGKFDWGAYSAGKLVDRTLYCIRRDRRDEFIGEGRRWSDLRRWRALDQMITTPFRQAGMKLWNCDNTALYTADQLIYGSGQSTVSSPERGDFLMPHELIPGDPGYNGFTWHLAHYLHPIPMQHLYITSPDSNAANSTIYQNPYYPLEVGASAIK